MLLVAGGTGFAPIKAIVEHALHVHSPRPMTLYWGVRRPVDLYLNELPMRWQREHSHLRYIPVLSEPRAEDGWTGRTGLVHEAVMADLPDLSGYQVYLCGAPAMVEAARRDFVQRCGLPEEEFFADAFTFGVEKTVAA
jgi:CDP-4-dehydro-6-deoxyglucose reductase